ncbi:uncharacterized protein BDR25DRAFT_391572 [Lindgomyces ingoldianus]|uniref:Uncharacterized protein n=1 Tax=Lindgomyces ingoldianus TaxID=673940 RepID=A0ACB6RAA7_9PLEO|nr:uncharacterized protein BDR25DRAFT_391572 [Lindgomyces ingoldianus]KAF2475467.1 hypothetical protein BDR25DRAFT_391572 [Lindgomyces ingoldianus]
MEVTANDVALSIRSAASLITLFFQGPQPLQCFFMKIPALPPPQPLTSLRDTSLAYRHGQAWCPDDANSMQPFLEMVLIVKSLTSGFASVCFSPLASKFQAANLRREESIWPKICLVSLPTEILQQIAGYLPVSSQASLAFTSRYLCRLIGTSTWINSWAKLNQVANRRKIQFLSHLARDMPAYAHCKECNILRPYDSECAWPLLRNHREERAIRPLVYSISEFLTQRTRMYYRHGRETGTCLSVLTCSGTYHKPWADQDIEDVGFSQEELKQGLPIKYSTTARLAKDLTIDRLITHVNYQINLPQHWSSFSVAQRYAILRDLYLCPHTYASKIQYRDPDDPTYPADSSIAHWLPSRGQIPDSIWRCSQCPTEFRARVGSDSGLVCRFEIDVWQHSTGSCGDGMIEMVHCGAATETNYDACLIFEQSIDLDS